MAEYIEKQAAIDNIEKSFDKETILNRFVRKIAISAVRRMEPVDIRPVVRGCWVFNEEDGHCYCSECGGVSPMDDQNGDECDCPDYCPNCGADMRGTSDE